jgi:multidrug efflux system membrane fusion protein
MPPFFPPARRAHLCAPRAAPPKDTGMNVKLIVSGAVTLGLVLAGYTYRDPIVKTVTGLFKGKDQAQSASSRSGGARKGRKGRSGGGTVSVSLATVEQRPAPLQLHAIGSVQALATVAIKARVDGQLIEAFFAEGDRVKKGQKLFRIDPRPFNVSLRQAEANLARDRAQFVKTKTDLARYGELVSMGYASQQKYEEVKAANAAAGAVLAADQAAVDQAKLQLEYTTIIAPIDGRTGNLLISVGNLVKANDANPLVTLTQLRPVYVSFSVPEQHLQTLRALITNQKVPVEARLSGENSMTHNGTLNFINNMVDVGTGTIQLKAIFPNPDESLTPGAFVNLSLTLKERPDAIVVPSAAIQVGQKGHFVFVAKENNTVEMRPVTITDTYVTYTVIAAGLKAGEKVVIDGQLNLVPGSRIRERSAGGNATAAADGEQPKKKKCKKPESAGGGS